MSSNIKLSVQLCILTACAPGVYTPVEQHETTMVNAPAVASRGGSNMAPSSGPPALPSTASDIRPQSLRLVAITDASDFALRPHFEDNEIVLPLPPQQSRLSQIDVDLLVLRQSNEEIVDHQSTNFSWRTQGAELRFFLPRLSGGDYVAEIRTTRIGDNESPATDDSAQVSFRIKGDVQLIVFQNFDYNFRVHHILSDEPALIPRDAALPGADIRLNTALGNNQILKITLDCWASSDGDAKYNMDVSRKRCSWVRENILKPALGTNNSIEIVEAAHGENNPPNPEPVGISRQRLDDIRQQNRVVVVKVYTAD